MTEDDVPVLTEVVGLEPSAQPELEALAAELERALLERLGPELDRAVAELRVSFAEIVREAVAQALPASLPAPKRK